MKACPRCSELYADDAAACPRDGTPLRAMRDPLIGKTVGGRFRLIQRLGAGGMSSVYLARHVLIDRLMAIKTLRRDLARDPVQRDRFLREARAVNRINHENIVEITDFGETEDGLVYLVMEYVPGEPLLHYLGQGPFGALRALDVAEQCASALARAHQMGVIHRDLKPENILLVQRKERPDFVKLLDFGIAKIMDAPSLTGSQQIFGTPGYIAPEYIQSTDIDGRADLYSLGCILYEMVTGALPFDYEYPGDLLVKHVTEPPVRPSARLPSIERPVEELILRALAKDPAERFRDAFHFKAELRSVRERLGPQESWGGMNEAPPRPVRDTERDPVPMITVGRPTAPYGEGLAIPEPPALDRMMETLEALGPDEPTPPLGQHPDGLHGARRWRERFDAIRAYLDELEVTVAAPVEVVHAMAFAERTLEELERAVENAQAYQEAVEALHERARDFRATIGRALDQVASRLSEQRGDFEALAARRTSLRAARESARLKMRRGVGSEGEADVLLWEQAAVEEELRTTGQRCDELEARLADLTAELDQGCEHLERERVQLVRVLGAQMRTVEASASALRRPLDIAEGYVRSHYIPGATEGDVAGS